MFKSAHGSTSAPRAWRLWLAVPLALSFLGADPAWDSLIERDEFGEPGDRCINQRKGWEGADGAMSARHTSTNRSFFFFGDTFLEPGNSSVFIDVSSTMLEAKTSPAHTAPNESPWGTNAEFWGRFTTFPFAMQRIGLIAGDLNNVGPVNGLSSLPAQQRGFYWVEDAIIRPSTNRLITIQSHLRLVEGEDPIYPRVCSTIINGGAPDAWPAATCADLKREVSPNVFRAPLEDGLIWGKSINYENVGGVDYYYIYGVVPATQSAVLARATGQTIMNYSQWQFFTGSGSWTNGPLSQPSTLYHVAELVGQFFNVEKIVRGSYTRYVMVQGGYYPGDVSDFLFVRIGKTQGNTAIREWYDPPAYVSDRDTWVGNIGQQYGIDPPCGNVVYGQLGQWDISNQGADLMKVSYHCQFVNHWEESSAGWVTPSDADQDGNPMAPTCDSHDFYNQFAYWRGPWDPLLAPEDYPPGYPGVGRVRFWNVPLDNLRPWCTTNCWMPL